jgi:hypothetical protein
VAREAAEDRLDHDDRAVDDQAEIERAAANLLSVGALDFGLIVDGTVIMVEAIFRRLSGHGAYAACPWPRRAPAPAAARGPRGGGRSPRP